MQKSIVLVLIYLRDRQKEVADMDARTTGALAPDHVADLVRVLDAVRAGRASTRPELANITGLGRNVVTQRVARLMDSGLLVEGPPLRSTGGRAPRGLRFPAEAGRILVAELGATSIGAAVSDLEGTLLAQYEEGADVTGGPVTVLTLWPKPSTSSCDSSVPVRPYGA